MATHFKLRKDLTKEYFGNTLYRVELTIDCQHGKAGDLGGWVENEGNLAENAWVGDNAVVFGYAVVAGNATVSGNAQIFGNARISENARVFEYAKIFGMAKISGSAVVSGNATVYGGARPCKRYYWIFEGTLT